MTIVEDSVEETPTGIHGNFRGNVRGSYLYVSYIYEKIIETNREACVEAYSRGHFRSFPGCFQHVEAHVERSMSAAPTEPWAEAASGEDSVEAVEASIGINSSACTHPQRFIGSYWHVHVQNSNGVENVNV